jgi:hypothetical protein
VDRKPKIFSNPETLLIGGKKWVVFKKCSATFSSGYIERGKVLLVGNMGLYDYRSYVRKVKNNRQIVFECGRGYKLSDGPPGATCIDGRWSPPDLPRGAIRQYLATLNHM